MAEVGDRQIKASLHLPVGVLGQADRAGLGDTFEPRGDVDAVAHQVAVAFLDHVAKMNADTKLDATLRGQAGVALGQAALHFDGAAHGIDDTAKLDEAPVAGPLDDAPAVRVDGGVDQVASQPPEPRQGAILVRPREPAVADNIRDQNRRDFPGSRHRAPLRRRGD